MIHRLTDGRIVDMDGVTRLNLLEVLTWLTYETDLAAQNKIKNGKQQNL